MKKKILSLMLTFIFVLSTIFTVAVEAAGSATGQQLVDCAMQYIGKVPYVWGGETIDGANPGADCSGFICRIYEKYGFNFWAYRTALRNYGTNLGTDMSVAQLGDIIWFEGHVAIYAGLNSKGEHMIVHETGGKYQNVAYTRVKDVNAALKGIIRIPGVVNNGETITISKATFSAPIDNEYLSKQYIGETNAVVVNQVNKLEGVSVTQMGLCLYDANGNLIKKHYENVTNVSASLQKYHSWYDINSELGITLTPGTMYQYRFFGVFDGQEISAKDSYSFVTYGTAPQVTPTPERYEITFITDMPGSSMTIHEISRGEILETLPKATDYEGYVFEGYYTAQTGGSLITAGMVFNETHNVTYYPRYTRTEEEIEIDDTYEHGYEVFIINYFVDGDLVKVDELVAGEKYNLDAVVEKKGYVFDGWYTEENGGTKLNKYNVVSKDSPRDLYAHYTKQAADENEVILTIGMSAMRVNGYKKKIDNEGTVPVIRNGRTLIPVRAVFEAMNGTVGWDGNARVVSLKKDNRTLFLKIDSNTAWDSEGNYYTLDSMPVIINGRTMLPIRFVVEYFDGNVEWDADTESVIITYFTERD